MILIDIKDGQGLGNQLWLLATGINLSLLKSRKLVIRNIQKFKAKEILSKEFYSNIQLFSTQHIDLNWKVFSPLGFEYKKVKSSIHFQESEKFLDLLDMYEHIEIDGNYQSISLIPKPEILRKYFKFNLDKFDEEIDFDNTCFINIRGGDYLGFFKSPCVSMNYIYKCVQIFKNKYQNINFKIITDDYKFSKIILPEFEILYGSIKEDFLNLQFAKYLILSNSSFAFFPTYLSNNNQLILAPFKWAASNDLNKKNTWLSPCNFNSRFVFVSNRGNIINNYNYFQAVLDSSHKILPPYKSMLFDRRYSSINEVSNNFNNNKIYKYKQNIKKNIILLIWFLKRTFYYFIR